MKAVVINPAGRVGRCVVKALQRRVIPYTEMLAWTNRRHSSLNHVFAGKLVFDCAPAGMIPAVNLPRGPWGGHLSDVLRATELLETCLDYEARALFLPSTAWIGMRENGYVASKRMIEQLAQEHNRLNSMPVVTDRIGCVVWSEDSPAAQLSSWERSLLASPELVGDRIVEAVLQRLEEGSL